MAPSRCYPTAISSWCRSALPVMPPTSMILLLLRTLSSAVHERLALVACGSAGSWCAHAGDLFHTPAFPIEPVDSTGAGDVFHGAFLYALLRGDALRRAVRFASAAAALSCCGLGGRGSLPSLKQVEALLGG